MNIIKPALVGVLPVALLALAACVPAGGPPAATATPVAVTPGAAVPKSVMPTPAAPVKAAATPLTLEALKNAEYPSEFPAGKKARLTDGKYEEEIMPGSASKLAIALHPAYAMGDLDGNGMEDAAVILVANAGGSGTFNHLVAVLNDAGRARPVAASLLGDRVKVETLAIKSGEIIVEMVTQGPQDPLCCPTQQAKRSFKLQGDKLILSSGSP